MTDTLSFRPIADTDLGFLRFLYASTRADEMALVPWSDADKAAFLDSQFEAQHAFYQQQFPQAQFSIVESSGEPIGRLYLDRRADEHRLIDIALVPEQRGSGIGTELLLEVLDEARSAEKKVRIHVEHNNPAMRLYRRLGFRDVEDQGVYFLMEWQP